MKSLSEQNVEYAIVKETPLNFLGNKHIGRVYLFYAPVRLIFTLDFDGSEQVLNPISCGYMFFCADDTINPAVEFYDDIVDQLCDGFMCDTEQQEQKIRNQAEELAQEIVDELCSLVEVE